MQLTPEQFERIRPVLWVKQASLDNDSKLYYRPSDALSRKLVNLDFFKFIVAPLFASQHAQSVINNVSIDNDEFIIDSDLKVHSASELLKNIFYNARNRPITPIAVPVTINFVYIVSIIMFGLLVVFKLLVFDKRKLVTNYAI